MKSLSLRHRIRQRFFKYWFGGWVYFWVGYVVFAVCYSGFHWNWFPSKVVADVIGWTLNYLVQRHWAFAEQHHLHEIQHLARYLIIVSVSFILDYAIIGGLKAAGITPYLGFFVAAAFFTIWNWFWYNHWVFPEKASIKLKP